VIKTIHKEKKDFSAHMLEVRQSKKDFTFAKDTIHILGNERLARGLQKSLSEIGFQSVFFSTVKNLRAHTTGREAGIIYCSPLKRSEILSVHHGLMKSTKFRNIPFFAAIPHWLSTEKQRSLYKAGIRALFEWPKETETFKQLFNSLLKLDIQDSVTKDSDEALRQAIETRYLAKTGSVDPRIEVAVYCGIVLLRGNVDSIGEKTELSQFVSKIPGVRGVVDQSVYVGNDMLPGLIRKKARKTLKTSETLPDRTLDVEVSPDEKTLTLVGSTASMNTANKAVNKLERFKGVAEVINRVHISPHSHSRDLALAKTAQRVIDKLSMGSPYPITVKIINRVAHIHGQATNEVMLHQIERAVRNIDGIGAVKSKLTLGGSSLPTYYS
jgi:osmotically-inducible protein OsmY